MMPLKALLIKMKPNMDIGDVVQIAKAEGSKLFHKPNRVSVVDLLRSPYGVIAVVQSLDGCSQKNRSKA